MKEVPAMKRRRVSLLLRIAVLVIAVWGAVTIVKLRLDIRDAEERQAAVQLEIDRQKRENSIVQELLDSAASEDTIADAARDELGYVSSNEIIFYDVSN